MKRTILFLLIFLACALPQPPADAGQGMCPGPGVKGYAATCTPSTGACQSSTKGECGTTYLLCEDLDGSADCGNASNYNCRYTWSTGDGRGYYNDTGATIEGTYSYKNNTWTQEYASLSTSGSMYAFVKAKLTFASTSMANTVYSIYAPDFLVFIYFTDNGAGTSFSAALSCGIGACNTIEGGISGLYYGTTYNIWIEYTKGSGSNASGAWYISSSTKPGTPTQHFTDGTGTNDPTRFQLGTYNANQSPSVINIRTDHIRVSTTQMTGVPD